MSEWISVENELPQADFMVLVCVDDDVYTDIYREGVNDGEYYFDTEYIGIEMVIIPKITHWMPLPEPPEQVNDKIMAKANSGTFTMDILSHYRKEDADKCRKDMEK